MRKKLEALLAGKALVKVPADKYISRVRLVGNNLVDDQGNTLNLSIIGFLDNWKIEDKLQEQRNELHRLVDNIFDTLKANKGEE